METTPTVPRPRRFAETDCAVIDAILAAVESANLSETDVARIQAAANAASAALVEDYLFPPRRD